MRTRLAFAQKLLCTTVIILLPWSTKSFVTGEAGGGLTLQNITDQSSSSSISAKGTQGFIRFQVDPLPAATVGFGLNFWLPKWSNGSYFSLSGLATDLEVTVWSPQALSGFKPFVRGGLTFFGVVDTESGHDMAGFGTRKVKTEYSPSGFNLAGGTWIDVIPMLKVVVEINYRMSSFTPNKKTSEVVLDSGSSATVENSKINGKGIAIEIGLATGV